MFEGWSKQQEHQETVVFFALVSKPQSMQSMQLQLDLARALTKHAGLGQAWMGYNSSSLFV